MEDELERPDGEPGAWSHGAPDEGLMADGEVTPDERDDPAPQRQGEEGTASQPAEPTPVGGAGAGAGAGPDARPDATPDATPDAGPDAGPDATPDATPDAAPDAAPAVELALGVWQPLDPRWVRAERVGWWLFNGVLLVSAAVGLGIWLNSAWWHWLLELIVLPLVLLGSVNLGMRWTRKQYRHVSWRVTSDGLEIRKGVYWRRALHVACTRVQHTDVVQGPVQRRFGISSLAIHTAGTSNATVSLEGLAQPIAQAVRDHLLAMDKTDGV